MNFSKYFKVRYKILIFTNNSYSIYEIHFDNYLLPQGLLKNE